METIELVSLGIGSMAFLTLVGFFWARGGRKIHRGMSQVCRAIFCGIFYLISLVWIIRQSFIIHNRELAVAGFLFMTILWGGLIMGILLEALDARGKTCFGMKIGFRDKLHDAYKAMFNKENAAHIQKSFAAMSPREQEKAIKDLKDITRGDV